jgi:hypothetical protein
MSTAMMMSGGKMDPTSKKIVQTGTTSDPMKGDKNAWFRSETKIISKNEHMMEMYSKGADGKEYRSMEIQYKRTR